MRTFRLLLLILVVRAGVAAPSPGTRFVIDDDEFDQKVTAAGTKLLKEGKLISVEALRRQIRPHRYQFTLSPMSTRRLEPPEVYEHLLGSTLAVGSLYKCADCGQWHFNSSAGFVIGEGGIVCTCCHVVAPGEGIKEEFLIAADAAGHVYAVRAVLGADTEADTCFLKVDAPGLKPLPMRTGVRTGERVYCLSHPGGYHFMFTQGLVSRINRRRNDTLDEHGRPQDTLTRPILQLNVTAEFAPGSSGAPVVDESGNVVAQVASIADAGDRDSTGEDLPPSPSVPVRFCTAAEEILRLVELPLNTADRKQHTPAQTARPRVRSHSVPQEHVGGATAAGSR
jgi:serine protease Do